MTEGPKHHKLKTWTQFFQEVWDDRKLFEVRFNDRDYQVGDQVTLQEYDLQSESYTGREVHGVITYVFDQDELLPAGGVPIVAEGWCVFGFKKC